MGKLLAVGHGWRQEFEVGGIVGARPRHMGARKIAVNVKCLPEGTLPKPTFAWGTNGRAKARAHWGGGSCPFSL